MPQTLSLVVIPLILLRVVSAQQVWQQPLTESFAGNWEYTWDESCTTSRITAFEQADGPVNFSTSASDYLEHPKISAVNATAWEQWEFDSVSDSGLGGIMVGFSRDASYAFFGQGNLRIEFYVVLSDGSVIQELEYVSESTLVDCGNFVTGTWNSTRRTYSFQVSKDMKHARLYFDSPRVQGSFTLTSVAPPHFPNGDLFPSDKASATELAPWLYMNQPIPGGRVDADITFSKKRVRFSGMGGHVRLWAKDSWFNICDGWHFMRAMAGPYTISYWQPISRKDKGVSYYSAQLFKDGKRLLTTQLGNVSETDDYVLFTDELDGELRGSLADHSTGHVLEFVAPGRGKRWHFLVQHMKKQFEMGLGGDSGLTGFTNRVTGGMVGGTQYEGRALSEQVVLPKTIAQWRIWIVLGIGFLNRGKSFVMNLVGYIF
ncbi:MAG: hypothetical protein Q9187_000537 [Circinaria calcarea]